MRKFLIILFVLSSTLFAQDKIEREFNLPLSASNYQTLREKFVVLKAKEKSREDFYFDLYEKEKYVLAPHFKMRLMLKADGAEWQVQKKISQTKIGFFTVNETTSYRKEINGPEHLMPMILTYNNQLKDLNPIALSSAKNIQQWLHEKGVILFNQTHCPPCEGQSNYFVTHTNKKQRLSLKVKLKSVQLDLTMGETHQDGNIAYELEAEQKVPASNETTSAQLLEWLKEQGYNEKDPAPSKKDATAESLNNLKRILQTQY